MEQLTLGQIIDKLQAIDPMTESGANKYVEYSFGYMRPTTLDSYRGYYDQLALGYMDKGPAITVKELLVELQEALRQLKTYEGWKGGTYSMDRKTPVWVANPGNTCSTVIVDIIDEGYKVVLITGYKD